MHCQQMSAQEVSEQPADGCTSASFPLGVSDFSGWATSSHCTIAMLSFMVVDPSL